MKIHLLPWRLPKQGRWEREEGWEARCPELPGNPPIGHGSSQAEAIGDLILKLNKNFGLWEPYMTPGLEIR